MERKIGKVMGASERGRRAGGRAGGALNSGAVRHSASHGRSTAQLCYSMRMCDGQPQVIAELSHELRQIKLEVSGMNGKLSNLVGRTQHARRGGVCS
jgi:hypothetical protein